MRACSIQMRTLVPVCLAVIAAAEFIWRGQLADGGQPAGDNGARIGLDAHPTMDPADRRCQLATVCA